MRFAGLRALPLACIALSHLACSSSGATAVDRDAGLADASARDDAPATESGVASGAVDGAVGDPPRPPTCTWTAGDHASQCPTMPCPIVEDVNVTCTDAHFASPGLRVAPAPGVTWLVTSSQNASYAFSIAGGQGTPRPGLPANFAYETLALALSPDGQPVLATGTQDYVTTLGDAGQINITGENSSQLESLGPDGWHGTLIEPLPNGDPVVGLEVARDGTPNVWTGEPPPHGYERATVNDAGAASTEAPVPSNGVGQNLFTLARDGAPVSFDRTLTGPTTAQTAQLHALVDGVDYPLDTVPGSGSYAVAHPPSPSQPAAGPRAAAAILEGDGIHVAGLGGQGWTETVIPSTLPFVQTCLPTSDLGCPAMPCHETAAGVLPTANTRGEAISIGLAWTDDGVAWLAYVAIQIDEQIQYASQSHGACAETVASGGASYAVHVVRVPLDGSPAREILRLPVPPIVGATGYTANSAQERTARFFDARAFGTDLALGFRTVDASGVTAVRVLRIDTTAVTASP